MAVPTSFSILYLGIIISLLGHFPVNVTAFRPFPSSSSSYQTPVEAGESCRGSTSTFSRLVLQSYHQLRYPTQRTSRLHASSISPSISPSIPPSMSPSDPLMAYSSSNNAATSTGPSNGEVLVQRDFTENTLHLDSYRPYTLEDLISEVGSKQLLQDISKSLFKGANPSYTWLDNNNTVSINIADIVRYQYTMKEKLNRPLSNAIRRQQELFASEKLIRVLLRSEKYKAITNAFLSRRANRANMPRIIKRHEILSMVKDKSLIILIDVENVPDFKNQLYIGSDGLIRFSSPAPPPARVAPSLSPDDPSDYDIQAISSPQDEDIIILSYAHAKSPQSIRANRITQDDRKDAADGALEFNCPGKKFVLVTNDKFGQSAETCFRNDAVHGDSSVFSTSGSALKFPMKQRLLRDSRFIELSYEETNFEWVSTCEEAVRVIGRIHMF